MTTTDTYICQVCGQTKDDCPTWRPDITGYPGAGNVCADCLRAADGPAVPVVVDDSDADAEPVSDLAAGPMDLARYNGTVTILNPATGGHRTFRIRTKSDRAEFAAGKRVVELLTGPDNTADYRAFAFVGDGERGGVAGRVYVWKSKRGGDFEIFADMLNRPAVYADRVQYLHSVRCRRCNRELTDPTSISLGIGPICRGEQ